MLPIGRRAALSASLAAGLVTLTACTENDSLAEKAGKPGEDYISGDGVVAKAAKADRAHPLDLDFTTLKGDKISLSDWRGKPVVINLWYAACPPCRSEAPILRSVAEDLGDDVNFLGVNVRDNQEEALTFIEAFAIPFLNMLDTEGKVTELLSDVLPPQATPATIILDSKGRNAARVVGEIDEPTLRELINYA